MDCCKKECPCARENTKDMSEESALKNKNFDMFVKLFKNDNSAMQKDFIRADPELSESTEKAAEKEIHHFVDRLNTIIAKK